MLWKGALCAMERSTELGHRRHRKESGISDHPSVCVCVGALRVGVGCGPVG